MSNQNDRGGGFLLWGISFVSSKLRNRKIRKYNKQSRGLEQHTSITMDALFPVQLIHDNIIISGGTSNERLQFCEKILQNAYTQKQPVIVLTAGNSDLENTIVGNGFGIAASRQRKIFDAFTFLELPDICQVVIDTQRRKYDIKPNGRYILQIAYDIILAHGLRPYFANFIKFTYHQIPDRIDECLANGIIAQSKANELKSLLSMGQTEIAKIDAFFYDAKVQIGSISQTNPNTVGASSALSAIWEEKIFLIDIGSSANIMATEILINTLSIAESKGYNFSLLIDDISVANNETLRNILCQKSSSNKIISTQDAFALFDGEERTFSTVVGLSEKTILLSHGSHISCEMWSKYIGEYDKIDTSQNSGGGWFQSSRWGYVSKQSQTETMKREQKIKPEEINRLLQGQIFAYDNQNGSLIQANII